MPSSLPARTMPAVRFPFKSSHRRVGLKVSHRNSDEPAIALTPARERYIAPPKARR